MSHYKFRLFAVSFDSRLMRSDRQLRCAARLDLCQTRPIANYPPWNILCFIPERRRDSQGSCRRTIENRPATTVAIALCDPARLFRSVELGTVRSSASTTIECRERASLRLRRNRSHRSQSVKSTEKGDLASTGYDAHSRRHAFCRCTLSCMPTDTKSATSMLLMATVRPVSFSSEALRRWWILTRTLSETRCGLLSSV
jgi:hypothetical protein